MFFLYHHHDLERLAELLVVQLERRRRAHPLESDTIIVPSHGIGRWLQIQIAGEQGIAANLDLPLPARFIWQLIPQLLPDAPGSEDYERARMRWHLYALLPEVAAGEPAVAAYLDGDQGEIQRLQLADRLADVFDQYLIYRPALLDAWQHEQRDDESPANWQAAVWRALVRRLGSDHRAQLLQLAVRQLLDTPAAVPAELPETVHLFAPGHLPPDYLRFFYALGQRIDVHFLMQNPCEGYWGDIHKAAISLDTDIEQPLPGEGTLEQQHPLLAANGRGIRDLLRVIYSGELTQIQEPELGNALDYAPPDGDSLLTQVQRDLIRMQLQPMDKAGPDRDISVQVHACHGPLREVQVLHDQLLDLLSRDDSLQPRDIVVLLPDIEAYAPAILSVFGAAGDNHRLPWSLADRSRITLHPLIQSFRRILDAPLSRWTASEILELLAVPAVMRRYDLDDAGLHHLRRWTQQAGVRWGRDRHTRERFGAGGFEQNSWQFGLDRLLLGVVQSDDESLVDGVAPWSDLEGGSAAALGSLWQFLQRLGGWCDDSTQPDSAAIWHQRLNALLEGCYRIDPADSDEQAAQNEIRDAIRVLSSADQCLGDEALDWAAVREILVAELSLPGSRQPWLSGGITFCSIQALRGVPFRVVCMLGMDDGKYPRVEKNRGFNLLRSQPRLGDHSLQDDDRLAFLQALCAARDVFYVSYTGQDTGSGEALPPSSLLAEWLEFLHQYYFHGQRRKEFESQLITPQAMHPFSRRYFAADPAHPRLFTFNLEWQQAGRRDADGRQRTSAPAFIDDSRADPPEDKVVELSQLRRFFDHPPRWFFQQCLHIDLAPGSHDIEDDEPIQLGGLQAYALRAWLLDRAGSGESTLPDLPEELLRARGVLPPPPLDAETYTEQAEDVALLLPLQRSWQQQCPVPGHADIDLALGEYRLTGRVRNLWPDGPRLMRAGRLKLKYRMRAWIDLLALRGADLEGQLTLAGLNREGGIERLTGSCTPDQAVEELTELLQLYIEAHRRPLPFMPELADEYFRHIDGGKSPADALEKVIGWLSNSFRPPYVASDPWLRPLLDGDPPLDDDFCDLVERAYAALRRALDADSEDAAA